MATSTLSTAVRSTPTEILSLAGIVPLAPDFVLRNPKVWDVFEKFLKTDLTGALPGTFDRHPLTAKLGCALAAVYQEKSTSYGNIELSIDGETEKAEMRMLGDSYSYSPYLQITLEDVDWIVDPAWLSELREMIGDKCDPAEIEALAKQLPFILVTKKKFYAGIINGIWERLRASGKAGEVRVASARPDYDITSRLIRGLETGSTSGDASWTDLREIIKPVVAEVNGIRVSFLKRLEPKKGETKEDSLRTSSSSSCSSTSTSTSSSSSSSSTHLTVRASSGCSMREFIPHPGVRGGQGLYAHKDGFQYYLKKDFVAEFYAGNLFKLMLGPRAATIICIARNEDTFYAGSEIEPTFTSVWDYNEMHKDILRSDEEGLADICMASWLLGERDLKGFSAENSNLGVITARDGSSQYFKIDSAQALSFEGEDFAMNSDWLQAVQSYCRTLGFRIPPELLIRAAQRIASIPTSEFERVCASCESQLAPYSDTLNKYVSNHKNQLFIGDVPHTTVQQVVLARVGQFKTLVPAATSSSTSSTSSSSGSGATTPRITTVLFEERYNE